MPKERLGPGVMRQSFGVPSALENDSFHFTVVYERTFMQSLTLLSCYLKQS
jgi:hypothetical protein